MFKVLANKVLAFNRGEKDKDGNLVRVKTVVGFCPLPDWVASDPYYIAALKDGSINAVSGSSEPEEVLKAQEKLAALQDEIKSLEEKRDMMKSGGVGATDANPDLKSPEYSNVDPEATPTQDADASKKPKK